jgi:EAL domain-containing protein (putative c-di-GMP-specific phosphodiesterase class I)
MGIQLALDDFGTGYSSLGYLTRFPIDKLKIDRSFVRGIVHDASRAIIVRAVVQMGQALGMVVNVEGVETAEQLAILLTHGVDEIQGFFFSRPVPTELFGLMLRNPVFDAHVGLPFQEAEAASE